MILDNPAMKHGLDQPLEMHRNPECGQDRLHP